MGGGLGSEGLCWKIVAQLMADRKKDESLSGDARMYWRGFPVSVRAFAYRYAERYTPYMHAQHACTHTHTHTHHTTPHTHHTHTPHTHLSLIHISEPTRLA